MDLEDLLVECALRSGHTAIDVGTPCQERQRGPSPVLEEGLNRHVSSILLGCSAVLWHQLQCGNLDGGLVLCTPTRSLLLGLVDAHVSVWGVSLYSLVADYLLRVQRGQSCMAQRHHCPSSHSQPQIAFGKDGVDGIELQDTS
jgi:hypothetical protein